MTGIVIPTDTSVQEGGTLLSPVSYIPSTEYSWQAWVEDGARFAGVGKSLLWWIGDWALYGEQSFGQEVYQAFADCGYEDDTIRDAMRVCRSWPQSDRCPELSYGHHRLLVTIPDDRRPGWIDDTLAFGWSCKDLRLELQRRKRDRELGVLFDSTKQEYHVAMIAPPYATVSKSEMKWPDVQIADDSMLLLICLGGWIQRAVGDLSDMEYRLASTMVIRPPITPPEPRDMAWVNAEASFVLVGVRGDLRAPLADERPSQFPSNLYDLAVQIDRAYPHLQKGTAWLGEADGVGPALDHPAWKNLAG